MAKKTDPITAAVPDPHAGQGGSYLRNPDGTRTRVEGTADVPAPASAPAPEPVTEEVHDGAA
jgi:hypothetical protein